jgi:hypothetical protein
VDVQAAIVVDEAQFAELIQKKTHSGARGADHLGERLLTDPRNHRLYLPLFTKVGEQQERPSQPLFARIKEVIDQILFDPTIAGQQIRHEKLRKRGLGVEHLEYRVLLEPHQRAVSERCGRRHTQRLPGQAALTKEGLGLEDSDYRFLTARRDDCELHLALLDIEHRVGGAALRKDRALRSACHNRSSGADMCEESLWIERVLVCHTHPHKPSLWRRLGTRAQVLRASSEEVHDPCVLTM